MSDLAAAEIVFGPLLLKDVTEESLGWSGGPAHLDYVADAVKASEQGETDMIAGRSQSGLIICYGGADYRTEDDAAKLWMLIVREELRGRGIGTQLFNALESKALSKVNRVFLHVETHNDGAKRLYERLGYVVERTDTESWYELDVEGERYLYEAEVFVMSRAAS